MDDLESVVLSGSLASLAIQGYMLDDIAVMFGVSRERVRQWYARDAIPPR